MSGGLLDIATLLALAFGIGGGVALGVRAISDAWAETDRHMAQGDAQADAAAPIPFVQQTAHSSLEASLRAPDLERQWGRAA
jgi:hypothetical protein